MIHPFTQSLLEWHTSVDRELPWKQTTDPYKIWISEIVMQQTRVVQGTSYYLKLIEAYPTVLSLSLAPEDELMNHWKGLGYYSRARNLKKAAQIIVSEHGGIFPRDYEVILKLPGIGPYTAAAICSFAYGDPKAVVDGNVYRVLSRYFAMGDPIDSGPGKKAFQQLADELIAQDQAAAYNQAIMDFGALICKPNAPLCDQCSQSIDCKARAEGTVALLPIKSKKLRRTKRHFAFYAIEVEEEYIIQKREEKDIWKSLYQFPMVETLDPLSASELLDLVPQGLISGSNYYLQGEHHTIQKLTHQDIQACILHIKAKKHHPTHEIVSIDAIKNLAFPRMLQQWIDEQLISNKGDN